MVLGSSGLVGQACVELFTNRDLRVIAPTRKDFEVRKAEVFTSVALVREMKDSPIIDALHSSDWQAADRISTEFDYISEIAKIVRSDTRTAPYIYLSSGSVYGPSSIELDDESPINILSSYARYKWIMENQCRLNFKSHKIFRLFFPYGKNQRSNQLIPRLVDQIQKGLPINCNVDGSPKLSMIDVRDVAQILLEQLDNGWSGTRNLAGGEVVKIKDLAYFLGKSLGIEPIFETFPKFQDSYVATPYDNRGWRKLEARFK